MFDSLPRFARQFEDGKWWRKEVGFQVFSIMFSINDSKTWKNKHKIHGNVDPRGGRNWQ